jgi:hypothetical protein
VKLKPFHVSLVPVIAPPFVVATQVLLVVVFVIETAQGVNVPETPPENVAVHTVGAPPSGTLVTPQYVFTLAWQALHVAESLNGQVQVWDPYWNVLSPLLFAHV